MIFNIFVALCLFQVAKTLWRVARKAERKYWELKAKAAENPGMTRAEIEDFLSKGDSHAS